MNQINLVFVSEDNHNKFYYMTDLGNGKFKAEWGRIGTTGQTMEYPILMWDAKLQDKLKKGYTQMAATVKVNRASDIKIADPEVKKLIQYLIKSAKTTLEASYQMTAGAVTQAQIDTAQALLNKASRLAKNGQHTQAEINSILKELYQAIPRRMTDTRKYFLRDDYQLPFLMELLQAEQNLLDTLESQSDKNSRKVSLEAFGLDIQVASQADRDLIASATDFKVGNQRIFKVTNKTTEAAFKGGKKTRLLYHGSRNSNWLAVLQKGLRIRPAGVQATGSMFGDAIYFANKAGKSLGYTSLKGSYWASGAEPVGYLAIFEVATGKEWPLLKDQRYQNWMNKIDSNRVKKEGFDSVFAKGGADLKNDEYVIYDSSRATIRFLIEVK